MTWYHIFLHSFSTGIGAIINYMVVWTVFLQNFTVQYGGRAAVAVAVGISSSLSLVSAVTIKLDLFQRLHSFHNYKCKGWPYRVGSGKNLILSPFLWLRLLWKSRHFCDLDFANMTVFQFSSGVLDVHGLMILGACLQALGALCCIFLLKLRQPDGTVAVSTTSQPITPQDHVSETASTNQEKEFNTANEKTRLTEDKTNKLKSMEPSVKSASNNSSSDGHVYGWDIMKLPDFWLLIVPFVIGCSIDKVILFNTGTYLRSFKAEHHLHTLVTVASWFLTISKVIVGLMSDLCIKRIPRVMYMVVILLLSVPLYFIFLVFADSIVFLYVITFFSYSSLGVLFVMGPVLIAEYFGVRHFGINYGSVLLVDGCFILLLQFVLGIIYDRNVTEVATHNAMDYTVTMCRQGCYARCQ